MLVKEVKCGNLVFVQNGLAEFLGRFIVKDGADLMFGINAQRMLEMIN